jgi:hypothetical protein
LVRADAAFLRRIGQQIYCGHIGADDYRRLWASECEEKAVAYDSTVVDFAIAELHGRRDVPLLPCHPRDLIGIALDKAAYTGAPYALTPELLEWAWNTYFVTRDGEAGRSPPGRVKGDGK